MTDDSAVLSATANLREPPVLEAAMDWLSARSPEIREFLTTHGVPVERRSTPGFHGLFRSIVGQQISVTAAASIWERIERACDVAGKSQVSSVDFAGNFLALDDEARTTLGLSRPKLRYVQALAEEVVSEKLIFADLEAMSDAAAIERLVQLPGIGAWSAEIYCLFALGRINVFPAGDLGLRRGAFLLFAENAGQADPQAMPTIGELRTLAEGYAPYRGAFAVMLWHVANVTQANEKAAKGKRT